MPNPSYSAFEETGDVKSPIKAPDARPAAPPATGRQSAYKMPGLPGPGRRVHKIQGRRVRTMARENF